jgi:dipeptidyl aminopeptidase/acylaminoacyl peptidase
MPDMKEVFDMVTKQTEPDLSSWNDQERRQRRTVRNRKVGAIALVAAVLAGAAIVALTLPKEDRTTDVGTRPETPSGPYHLNLTTLETTSLPDTLPEASLYAVSPDGTMIAGAPCCSPPNPVWVANIDGTGVRAITPEGIDGFAPRWSPDGSMLVYQERDAATEEIGNLVVVDVATGERTTITDLGERSYGTWSLHPSFSADGRSVLFRKPSGPLGVSDPAWDLASVPVTGGEFTYELRDASLGATSPRDGSFVYVDPTNWTLYVADADGRNARMLLEVGEEITRLLWSPTGSEVAYADASGVHIVDLATGTVSLVTDGDPVDWSW